MTDKWHGGKGSKQRPINDRKKFEENWNKIFSKKKEEKVLDKSKK